MCKNADIMFRTLVPLVTLPQLPLSQLPYHCYNSLFCGFSSAVVEKEVAIYLIETQNLLEYCSLHLGEMQGRQLYVP